MYTIYQMADGTYACVGKLQDGTERWTECTLAKAVASMIQFAKVMNGSKIKKKQISFYRQVTRNLPTSAFEPWDGKA